MKAIIVKIISLTIIIQPITANLFESIGSSSRTIGLAGGGRALARGWSSAYVNPAGLAGPSINSNPKPNHQFGITYTHQVPLLNISLKNNNSTFAEQSASQAEEAQAFGFIQGGFMLDIRQFLKTPFNIAVRMGASFGLPSDGTVSAVPELSERRFNFKRTGLNNKALMAAIGLGLELWPDRLSVGLIPSSKASMKGNAEISNISLNEESPPVVNAKFDLETKFTPSFGAMYRQPLPNGHNIYASFAYRSALKAETELTMTTILPFGLESSATSVADSFLTPEIFEFALAYQFGKTIINLDTVIQKWSTVVLNPARASFELPTSYRDIIIVSLGIETPMKTLGLKQSAFDNVIFRSGYSFTPSFTPDQTDRANILDNTKHIWGFGLSKPFSAFGVLKKNFQVDFGFQWQFLAKRSTVKTSGVTFLDGSLQPDFSYSGHIFVMSCGITFFL